LLDASRADSHALDATSLALYANPLQVGQKAPFCYACYVEADATFIFGKAVPDNPVASPRPLAANFTNSGHTYYSLSGYNSNNYLGCAQAGKKAFAFIYVNAKFLP
jgi:hypothetical protein